MGAQLKAWRQEQGYSTTRLGALLGVGDATISRYERGRRLPEPAIMVKLYVLSRGAVQPNDFYDLPDPTIAEAEGVAA